MKSPNDHGHHHPEFQGHRQRAIPAADQAADGAVWAEQRGQEHDLGRFRCALCVFEDAVGGTETQII